MEKRLVTVTDLSADFSFDMEIPAGIRMDKVCEKIGENLRLLGALSQNDSSRFRLICSRTNRWIEKEKTAEENGIWTGDYLTIVLG